jgi:hypothetical protein
MAERDYEDRRDISGATDEGAEEAEETARREWPRDDAAAIDELPETDGAAAAASGRDDVGPVPGLTPRSS